MTSRKLHNTWHCSYSLTASSACEDLFFVKSANQHNWAGDMVSPGVIWLHYKHRKSTQSLLAHLNEWCIEFLYENNGSISFSDSIFLFHRSTGRSIDRTRRRDGCNDRHWFGLNLSFFKSFASWLNRLRNFSKQIWQN